MIKVEGLSKIYGDHIAVDDISFEVQDGHIYGFLGPNGAGKSTTMNIITGYLSPSCGTVEINGFIMGKDTVKAKKNIGYLPEIPPLYPDMRVKEYLDFVARIKGVSKKGTETELSRADEVLRVMEATNITVMADRLIKHLSKGYKQRVGIAQALIGNPALIILDEPTVGLDPEQIIEVRDLIKSLKGKHTVIISSHILSEISATCDEVLVIANGRMIACDTTEHLMADSHEQKVLKVAVKGDKDKVEEVLRTIKDVNEIKFVENKGEGVLFEITTDSDKDIREEISFALLGEKLLILEMSEETITLEDTYLTLVKKADEEYKAEMEALASGAGLDEVYGNDMDSDKEDSEENVDAENESDDEEKSSDEEEVKEDK